ncbi:hypothetical protein SAMN04488693_1053 [Arthrobacter subterraneus]|uniref:Uncharacterized protein n=1 Tax=Arthrobacter subterraneus TaxID=335973 RepID=A0A1G8GZ30_9MICC|nr:hypothetical protein [Arthrobacter subterraneus]SDH99643.1 hypothetical protein SAMN04488693_1053 [Arthrobacter subterraneus]
MTADAIEEPPYFLHHPVYLDTPMMTSFLAHLEGGISTDEEEVTRQGGFRDRLLAARTGFRFNLPLVADVNVGGDGSTQSRDESNSEVTTNRHHTSASLFNALYKYLREDGQLTSVTNNSELAGITSGRLVEINGRYLGNPLEDMLIFVDSLVGYLKTQQDASPGPAQPTRAKAKRSGNPAVRSAATTDTKEPENNSGLESEGVALVAKMAEDIRSAHVHDLLMRTDEGLSSVLTVSSDFYTSATNEYLKSGDFTVVGKVTRVFTADESINLSRRTVLGAVNAELAQGVIDGFSQMQSEGSPEPVIVAGPAVQILPMAIFV